MQINPIMRFQKHLLIISIIVLLFIGRQGYAQYEFTLYHMPALAQSSYLNPAAVPEHKVSVFLPIPSVYAGFNNSAISVKALLSPDGTIDYNKFVDGLADKNNYLGIGAKAELFHVRFKAADNFFSLSSQVVNDVRLLYPKDFMALAAKGLEGNYSLTGMNLDMNSYIEYAVGFTRARPDSKWTYGARLKYLNGLANIQTKNTDISVTVNNNDIYTYDINAKMLVNVGAAVDGEKYKDLEDLSNININNFSDAWKEYKPNKGLAADLGATFQFTNQLSFGASLINLGYIRWKNFKNNYTVDSHILVEGVNIEVTPNSNLDSLFNAQVDSLGQAYADTFKEGVDTSYNAYTTWMPTQLLLTTHYQLTPKFRTSASVITEFYRGVSVGTLFGANYRFGRTFDLTASWWWFRKSAANLGIGMVFKPWFGQLYLVMDNVLPATFVKINDPELQISNLWLPYSAQNFNVRIGMNLVFGRIRDVSRLPLDGLSKKRNGRRKYLYKTPFKK